jgi:hypothetical protein
VERELESLSFKGGLIVNAIGKEGDSPTSYMELNTTKSLKESPVDKVLTFL